MERALRPATFDAAPNTPSSEKEFKYWRRTLDNYLATFEDDSNNLKILINHISPSVYEFISEETSFQAAIDTLKRIFEKPQNVVFARHVLSIRKQQPGESVEEYLQALRSLSKDCNFQAVDANNHRDQFVRDAFIAGLQSSSIRQRLLENNITGLNDIFSQARSLEHAQKNVALFNTPPSADNFNAAIDMNAIAINNNGVCQIFVFFN